MSNRKDVAVSVAIAETLTPTLGVTEQILETHQLVIDDGQPAILWIDDQTESEAFFVYFAIEAEPYQFVIVIRSEQGGLIPSAAYIEAATRVYLVINSVTLSPEQITAAMMLVPTRTHLRGEPINLRSPQLSKINRWYFEPQSNKPGSLEGKLKVLLDKLEGRHRAIADLKPDCEIYICICYHGYRTAMGGWHLDPQTLQRLAAFGIDVDLDLYAA
jgi:hypothetical protein